MMWPGHYTLKMEIWDVPRKPCGEKTLHVTVCTCDEAKVCLPKRRVGTGVSFGAFGVLIMLLGLLLLMCKCIYFYVHTQQATYTLILKRTAAPRRRCGSAVLLERKIKVTRNNT